jgi:SAM-dependent methyltransferase
MLGVTPETAACAWPEGTRLRAYDGSPEMLRYVWPKQGAPADARAELGDWASLPLDDRAADLVTADNSLGVVYWPGPVKRVLDEIRRVLRPAGRFVVRQPILPERPETLDDILADLNGGRIGTPGAVKARMWAVLQRPDLQGMKSQDLRDLWWRLFPDPEAIAPQFGWSSESFATQRKVSEDRRTTCVTRVQFHEIIDPFFRVVDEVVGSYELAERFPTFVLEPRRG